MTKFMRVLAGAGWALASCGGSSEPGVVHPDDMSAAEHRHEASEERASAEDHVARYTEAQTHGQGDYGATTPDGQYVFGLSSYDPSSWHLTEAERHSTHALAHEQAARELERFEKAECGELPPAARGACPILAPVASVEDRPSGIRIHFARGANVAALLAHMRCHLAYARARGYGEASACPLYVRGVTVAPAAGGAIDVLGDAPPTVEHIRRAVRETAIPRPR